MTDFYSRLLGVLSYCDKNCEDKVKLLSETYSDFSSIAKTDASVTDAVCGEKISAMIRVISAIAGRITTDKFKFGRTHTEKELFEFLIGYYFDIVNETVLLLPIDKQNRIISAELIVEGTVNFSGVLTRKLLEIMIRTGAKSAILVHNHPGGNAVASAEDIETTRIVSQLLKASDMNLVCHYIVAGNEITRLNPDSEESKGNN